MPATRSAWILPTEETVYLDELSHSEVVIKFLSGLLLCDEALGKYCLRDFKRFLKRAEYKDLHLSDAIEDYAVLCLRWIKIGNAYKFYNNKTTTIPDYDMFIDKIRYYYNIGFHVNVIPITIHCYETIAQTEYNKLDVKHVISCGNSDYEEYVKTVI